MAKTKNLVLEEFSIVRGSELRPANPGAVALAYKAEPTKKESQMDEKTKAAAAKKSLASQVADAVKTVLGTKAQTVRVSEYNHVSQSTSRETIDDGQEDASGGSTTIVITDATAVEKTESAPAKPAEAKAAAQPQDSAPAADLAEVVTKAVEPLVQSVTSIDERLAAVEKSSVGSKVMKTAASANPNDGAKFPAFKSFLEQMTPGQRLSKAVITAQNWQYGLSVDEATKFLQYIVDESTLLKRIRTEFMNSPTKNIDKIGLGSKVLVKATPGVDPGDTVSLSGPTQIQLVTKEIIGIVSVGDDTLEDNIEGDAFLQTLLGMIARAAANEIEQAAIHGDTAVADDFLLDRWNGFYKKAITGGCHRIEAMADADRYWPGANGAKATRVLKSLPTKYRQDTRTLGWILHPDAYLDYNDELATKGYSEAFASITGIRDVPLRGIQNVQVPLLKTDMVFNYGEPAVEYTNGTIVMLTDLRNLIIGLQRQIRIETQRNARKRATDFVLTMRGDVQVENPDAIVIYDHAQVKAA
ncbi:MAG: hypothetical protein AMXMBFR13_12490 [Phycisphaerae bacterium]